MIRPGESSDLATVRGLDTSFTTDRVYGVQADGLGFRLVQRRLPEPLKKVYPFPSLDTNHLMVATLHGDVVGFGQLVFEQWNRRARIEHLYVAPRHRGQGVGRALLTALEERASAERGTRCLWLETQNVNHPAVQFYLHQGFRFCGLDLSLYDPKDAALVPGGEVALYFSKDLSTPATNGAPLMA